MVHSSLASLGFVPGGARGVIKALLRALGPEGTLVMPSHSWDRAGGGDFSFDVRNTPGCVGKISEVFRTMPGVSRSLHPTHSVIALGPRANHLTQWHEDAATPCGPGTPYMKLIEERSQVLFVGASLDQNTLFHTLEAVAHVPYLLRDTDEAFTITDASGTTRVMRMRRHNRGPNRKFAATLDLLEHQGVTRSGPIGASESLLVECAPMAELILTALRKNPNVLLE